MDKQTYNYMRLRVEKSEQLLSKIASLKERVQIVKAPDFKQISVRHHSVGFTTSEFNDKQLHISEAHVEARMVNAYIEATNKEIAILEQEFAEL